MRIALVTGTVGIGKSATGYAVAERAASQGRSAALLDVDELSRLWPAPAGDPFNDDLILRNLASLVGNYAAMPVASCSCWPGISISLPNWWRFRIAG